MSFKVALVFSFFVVCGLLFCFLAALKDSSFQPPTISKNGTSSSISLIGVNRAQLLLALWEEHAPKLKCHPPPPPPPYEEALKFVTSLNSAAPPFRRIRFALRHYPSRDGHPCLNYELFHLLCLQDPIHLDMISPERYDAQYGKGSLALLVERVHSSSLPPKSISGLCER